jgi:cellulose synthase/poly-beta-1,6-N-acetylglucosamine synthase-like glycosyltransferase
LETAELLLVYAIATLYFICQTHLFIVSIAQFILLFNSLKKGESQPRSEMLSYPFVTVQLPVYNEKYVVNDLIDCLLKLDYSGDKLEIQLLDDSTDDTTEIIKQKLESIETTILIKHITRTERLGYKAGALQNGLRQAQGEFIAIFDADFRPAAHFLTATLPYFNNPNVGMVQTRCGYHNRTQTLITRTLAFGMDIYYTIEQSGRHQSNVFFIFNGTGGIWRKSCIEDAGNWQGDTLAEDMDLSYRAQLKGWKFEYTEEPKTNGELPPFIAAVRVQQYRWIKGSLECARKIIPLIGQYSSSWYHKFHAYVQLTNSFAFLSIFICSILSIPMMFIKNVYHITFAPSVIFGLSSIVVLIQVFVSIKKSKEHYGRHNILIETFVYLPLSLVIFMGLYIENARAALHGLMGKKTPFVRTPKVGSGHFTNNEYFKVTSFTIGNFFELLMIAYFAFGIFLAAIFRDIDFVVFHLCLIVGYFLIFYHSIKENNKLITS